MQICARDLKLQVARQIKMAAKKPQDKYSFKTLKPGDGTNFPKKGDTCRVHYVGKLKNGKVFDDTRQRGRPVEFTIGQNQVIEGWERALSGMSKGQIARISVPPTLGYGDTGYPPIIPPSATVIYELELIMFQTPSELSK